MSFTKEEVNKINPYLVNWVDSVSKMTEPSEIWWCDGSSEERTLIEKEMLSKNLLIKLNEREYPNCYLFRNKTYDTARDEARTFICTTEKVDAGPTNNWMSILEAKAKLFNLFKGCMEGRRLYAVPYLLGPENSEYSQAGVELTDSPLVVLTLGVLTRMGKIALEDLGPSENFIRGVHSTGNLDKENRYVCHFPGENLIMSINTNYVGDAALSKKPHALRLASVIGKKEGWLAEHMFTVEIKTPMGKIYYVSGALPSGSGKTNLALIKPPEIFKDWETKVLGDDLNWLHADKDGRLISISPEAGFFGTAYGVGTKTLPRIMPYIKKNTLFTNVGLTQNNEPWWEGLTEEVPKGVTSWTGTKWIESSGSPVANKNGRYTIPISQYPFKSEKYNDPNGVPLSTIIFGGRRADLVPLVYEAYSWEHGILVGIMMRVETTSAQLGKTGIVRSDPMAMLAFCGYNMGDYFTHWIEFGKKLKKKPRIFSVNWFRKDINGKYLWPGFSENFRIIKWMLERGESDNDHIETPIGYVPNPDAIDLRGLKIKKEDLEKLLYIDTKGWLNELEITKEFLDKFGDRTPKEIWDEYFKLEKRLKA